MNIKNIYYRPYQFVFCNMQRTLPWRMPKVIKGNGSMNKLPYQVKNDGLKKVQIITTSGFIKRGSLKSLFEKMEELNLAYIIYDKVLPDPTIECIEDAVKEYKLEKCEGIIAVGGGSVLDCAKLVGARIVRPEKTINKMAGLLKVRKKLPPIYAVPTTAGTGSETTVAAVVTDSLTHRKYAVSDICLMPLYAVLDPQITCNLPKNLTSTTGMDALTHAVEAYTNKFSSKESKKYAMDATKMIFNNLTKAYDDGMDMKAREKMLLASFYAGAAFTKSYVGYVHALAHAIGGLYGVPHGYANAVILPVVLENFGEGVYTQLAELADAVGIKGESERKKAENFIVEIKNMNKYMGIPDKLEVIKEADFEEIISRAIKEANPTYPVPVIWHKDNFKEVLKQLIL